MERPVGERMYTSVFEKVIVDCLFLGRLCPVIVAPRGMNALGGVSKLLRIWQLGWSIFSHSCTMMNYHIKYFKGLYIL